MGKLIDGRWVSSEEAARTDARGAFVRGTTKFRDRISADGGTPFAPEAGRYHLFVAYNCPWAHRTMITRRLKGLESIISVSYANVRRNEQGWWYAEGLDDLQPDADSGQLPLHRFYSRAASDYNGSATVPVLWDRQTQRIVNNESAEIIRMLDGAFGELASGPTLCPPHLRETIDAINAWVYPSINNGVYRCGFARSQEAYDEAFDELFDALDRADAILAEQRYLAGDQLTEADVRIFPTLIRFDAVYNGHFKCNRRRILDYPALWPYLRDLYQTPGFGETVRIDLYKQGYYGRSPRLNPSGIIPRGPDIDFAAPHGREAQALSPGSRATLRS